MTDPLWKTVFQDNTTFTINTMQLVLKGSSIRGGMRSVHTYHTPDTRGLIRVGEKPGDVSKAHVVIENRSGTQAVGMHIRAAAGNTNDVMEILPVILRTFSFTTEHLNSSDEVKRIIAEAGILPRDE